MKSLSRKQKVRYHLQNGKHKNHWQFKNNFNKLLFYIDPKSAVIRLTDCVLINKRSTADQIYSGSNKNVCAWIDHSDYKLLSKNFKSNDKLIQLNYNPKKMPFWNACDTSKRLYDLDNAEFKVLYLGYFEGILGVYSKLVECEREFTVPRYVCF